MIVIPAIDIINKQPVRLYQGDYGKKEIVADSVKELANTFVRQGAEWIHMVDLDGAKAGTSINRDFICEIAQALPIPVEVGGGIRTMESAAAYLEHGVQRVILGTSAIEDESFLKQALHQYKERIAVGLDCKDGYVCTRGWLNDSHLEYRAFAKHLEALGVATIIFTDIARDGTLNGPNLAMLQALKQTVSMNIIASGGVKDLTHIQQLLDLEIYGAITGKAVVANTLPLQQAVQLTKQNR